ncbi:hypothetical protein WJ968_14980 [Achromobacter xylosoxidans]
MDHQVEQSALRHPPVVLDTDSSVGALPGEIRLALNDDWREAIRFGCRQGVLRSCIRNLTSRMPAPADHGTVFMGSGDFHHLSWPLIERCAAGRAPPACAWWCWTTIPTTCALPGACIAAPGCAASRGCRRWRTCTSSASLPATWAPRMPGNTTWVPSGAARSRTGAPASIRAGRAGWAWGRAFAASRPRDAGGGGPPGAGGQPMDTYFSIDKDAFDEVRTNWDQGVLLRADLKTLAQALHGQIVGSDVTGDVSVWHYRTAWKRWLSAADGQDTAHQDRELPQWQARQNAFNWQIVELLDAARAR